MIPAVHTRSETLNSARNLGNNFLRHHIFAFSQNMIHISEERSKVTLFFGRLQCRSWGRPSAGPGRCHGASLGSLDTNPKMLFALPSRQHFGSDRSVISTVVSAIFAGSLPIKGTASRLQTCATPRSSPDTPNLLLADPGRPPAWIGRGTSSRPVVSIRAASFGYWCDRRIQCVGRSPIFLRYPPFTRSMRPTTMIFESGWGQNCALSGQSVGRVQFAQDPQSFAQQADR
jgi:hypothetical protein